VKISDEELIEMQDRALRVLGNGTTSGSARRLAHDSLRLTAFLLSKSRTYKVRAAREERVRRQREVFSQLGDVFKQDVDWEELDDRDLLDL
jgi:hypothetical protein